MPALSKLADYGSHRREENINRAIRAEMVGGDDCLDALALLHRLATRLKERGLAGQREAQAALNSCRDLATLMGRIIEKRYADQQGDVIP